MRKSWIVTSIVVSAVAVVACSGGDGGGTGSEKTTTPVSKTPSPKPSATTEPNQPSSSTSSEGCVAKGAKGNAAGIGAYCMKGAECGDGLFCTAEFGAPAGADFCTKPCTADAECGEGAVCYTDPRGRGCVPVACAGK